MSNFFAEAIDSAETLSVAAVLSTWVRVRVRARVRVRVRVSAIGPD